MKLLPEQRQALDEVADHTGQSRSEALRTFLAYGFAAYRRALDAIDHAEPAAVLGALVGAGATRDEIAHAIKENAHGSAR